MTDDTGRRGDGWKPDDPEADAATKLLEEQQARIAALRAAVLAGQVPDDEASFDYARFFGTAAEDAPER